MAKKPDYPTPKKNQRVKCLACNDGKVYDKVRGWRACKACEGQGYIHAN